MPTGSVRATRAVVVTALAATFAVTGVTGPPPVLADPTSADQASTAAQASTVTLLSGDVVHLTRFADGRQAATVEPGPGREQVPFQTRMLHGDLYVVPGDAEPYLADGRIDAQLFDVTGLVRQGYDDAHDPASHVIASYDPAAGSAATAPAAPAASIRTRVLPRVHAAALRVDKGQAGRFWRTVTRSGTPAANSGGGLAQGIRTLWLDARVTVTGKDSVARIGAPEAWAAGYDGTGVKVAVLDTGVDTTHPDLAGKVVAQANFSQDTDAVDHQGHGTHVASTVVGSGAASGGAHRGVAPGATLLSGKVLDTYGSGTQSSIIAGMDWAAAQGADVVNMSLGATGYYSDGTDPMSQEVDALTAQYDMLFVIAAGNEGPTHGTVSAPGSASSALTVGAVDDRDHMATFSSRGPRAGDGAVKPEVVAPGVDITAARAAGSTFPASDGPYYTTLSGTSMATPHVTGAAAILRQEHPDWTAARVKAALVSTAAPLDKTPVYEQGAGRIDLARATDQPVVAEPGTLGVNGTAADRTVTYRNSGTSAVTLNLTATLAGENSGHSAPSGAVALSAERVTVPAGGARAVTVRLDPGGLGDERQVGALTAATTNGHTVARTMLAVVPADRVTVTVRGAQRDGSAPATFSKYELWNLDTGEYMVRGFDTPSVKVPAGRYLVNAYIISKKDNVMRGMSVVVRTDVALFADTTLTLDARTATEVRQISPRPTDPQSIVVGLRRTLGQQDFVTMMSGPFTADQVYLTPTDRPDRGSLDAFVHWELADPRLVVRSGDEPVFTIPLAETGGMAGGSDVEVVDGGDGSAAALAAAASAGSAASAASAGSTESTGSTGLAGKAVLVRAQAGSSHDLAAAALAAGARYVLLWDDGTGCMCQSAYPAVTDIVGMWVPKSDGQLLADRIAAGGGSAPLRIEGHAVARYAYDLVQRLPGRIPSGVTLTADEKKLARLDQSFHADRDGDFATDGRVALLPDWPGTFGNSRQLHAPAERTDWVTPGMDWYHEVATSSKLFFADAAPAAYRAGSHGSETWGEGPLHPAIAGGAVAERTEDALYVAVAPWQDADGHIADAYLFDTASYRFLRDGQVLASGARGGNRFTVGPDPATYTYELTENAYRNRQLSTQVTTAWTFRSGRPAAGIEALPFLQLGYDLPLDGTNSAPGDAAVAGTVRVTAAPGTTTTPASLTVQASYDDGATWTDQQVEADEDGAYRVSVDAPPTGAGNGHVALRVEAHDTSGNAVTQTILRAYALR